MCLLCAACLRELYVADVFKPGVERTGRPCANAWDLFRRTLFRVGRGRRAAVVLVYLNAA